MDSGPAPRSASRNDEVKKQNEETPMKAAVLHEVNKP
jgi:hypothetical protein